MKQSEIHAAYSGRRKKKEKKMKIEATVSKHIYEALSDAAYLYDTPLCEVLRAALKEWLRRHYKKDPFSL